ncbi:hypothetical protein E2C01_062869 [Portunus trituberculatus]|uniref:Uncharacterized protein n=1 Tax=Portunus trituberculatus TaxID=210409 RepID=A0A5B7HGM1_PORTR|nr:hypothetical protein [Portunus trituberculatus]
MISQFRSSGAQRRHEVLSDTSFNIRGSLRASNAQCTPHAIFLHYPQKLVLLAPPARDRHISSLSPITFTAAPRCRTVDAASEANRTDMDGYEVFHQDATLHKLSLVLEDQYTLSSQYSVHPALCQLQEHKGELLHLLHIL